MDADSVPSSGAAEANSLLYGPSPGLSRFPLGDTTELVYCPYDRRKHSLSAAEAAVLQACQSFAPLAEHARRNLEAGKLDATSIQASLEKLVGARLLVPQQDLVARCLAHKPDNPTPAQIASVCIPTRNRPEMLQRCVESYIQCAQQYARHINFVIVDSSDDASIRGRNVETLSALKSHYGVGIAYLGPEEKQDFARRLAARGLDRPSVDFAILNPEGCPNDTGSNRNALLLSTVGECTVQVDDDTICRVMPWLGTRKGVRFTSAFDPTEFVFPDEDEDIPAHRFEAQDFYALHETLLGRSAGELIEQHGLDAQGFVRPKATLLRRIEGGGAQVAATALGVAGDSGMASSAYFLTFEGESRAGLMRSERVYRNALSEHRLIRAAPQMTVVDDALCMTLNLGLDNSRLLPPFMPVQRGEDDMFAAILRSSAEGSTFGFMPWALAHEPPPRRRPALSDRVTRLSTGHVMLSLVRSFSPIEGKGPESNLLALGQWLDNWGRAPARDLGEFARVLAWQQASRQIAKFEGLQKKYHDAPQFWAGDAANYVAMLQASVAQSNYAVPVDLEVAFGSAAAMPCLQRLASRFGELVKVWPDLREAALQERASGNPIGRRI